MFLDWKRMDPYPFLILIKLKLPVILRPNKFEVVDLGQGLTIENNGVQPLVDEILDGNKAGYFVFDGIDNYLSIKHPSLNIFEDKFTISFWLSSKALNPIGFIDFKGYTILNYKDFQISIGTEVITSSHN